MVSLASEFSLQLHMGAVVLEIVGLVIFAGCQRAVPREGRDQEMKGKGFFCSLLSLLLSPLRRRRGGCGPPAAPAPWLLINSQGLLPREGPRWLCACKVTAKVALAGKQRGVLARPHQAPLGNRVQAEIQASLDLPVGVWLLAVPWPQQGTSFPSKASCALSSPGPCAGPPGTCCPVAELDQK